MIARSPRYLQTLEKALEEKKLKVLKVLLDGPKNQNELGLAIGKTGSAVTTAIQELKQTGYITQKRPRTPWKITQLGTEYIKRRIAIGD